jgi:hypothetical protein
MNQFKETHHQTTEFYSLQSGRILLESKVDNDTGDLLDTTVYWNDQIWGVIAGDKVQEFIVYIKKLESMRI